MGENQSPHLSQPASNPASTIMPAIRHAFLYQFAAARIPNPLDAPGVLPAHREHARFESLQPIC